MYAYKKRTSSVQQFSLNWQPLVVVTFGIICYRISPKSVQNMKSTGRYCFTPLSELRLWLQQFPGNSSVTFARQLSNRKPCVEFHENPTVQSPILRHRQAERHCLLLRRFSLPRKGHLMMMAINCLLLPMFRRHLLHFYAQRALRILAQHARPKRWWIAAKSHGVIYSFPKYSVSDCIRKALCRVHRAHCLIAQDVT